VLNLTGLDADQTGYITVYPCDEHRPLASNLNLTPGLITANLVISRVGTNGRVCIYTQRTTSLIADLVGVIPTGSAYQARPPVRVLDTRPDGPQIGYAGSLPAPGSIIEVVAPKGVDAIALNVTAVDASADGFITVFPCGGPIPTASNLNVTPGRISANLTITRIGSGGKVCIYTQRGTHLVADLVGTFDT
jgi:hypothetical protein